jgi:hypothetical protein
MPAVTPRRALLSVIGSGFVRIEYQKYAFAGPDESKLALFPLYKDKP